MYRKSLTMAPKKELNSGQVVNLVSAEAFLIADSTQIFVMGLSGPFQVVCKSFLLVIQMISNEFSVSIVLLGVYVNYYLVILVGVVIVFLPISIKLGRKVGLLHYLASLKGDRRLKLINELLSGIRIVKYYAWENAFKENIENQRDKELKDVYQMTLNRSAEIFLMQNVGSLAQGITLVSITKYLDRGSS